MPIHTDGSIQMPHRQTKKTQLALCPNYPFASGSVFKQRGAGFSFLIISAKQLSNFFLVAKAGSFFHPCRIFYLCRRAYATPLIGGVNAPCPAQRSFCCCRCGGYRLVMQVMSPNTTPGELAMAIGQSRCFLKRPYATHRVQLMAAQSGWIGLPLCPARLA